MKAKLLHLFAVMAGIFFANISATAQTWDLPEDPLAEGLELSDGAEVVFYNVEAGLFMSNGKVSAPWDTQTSLVSSKPLKFRLVDNGDDTWTIQTASGPHSGKNVISPFAGGDRPYCYVDANGDPNQGCISWYVDGDAEMGYTFDLLEEELAEDGTFLGTPSAGNKNVVCNANPDNGGEIYWKFIDPADAEALMPQIQIYKQRVNLYEIYEEALEYPSIDLTPYTEVYCDPNATVDQLAKAVNSLKAAVNEAKIAADGDEPTIDNPIDVTEMYFTNPSFDGDINGWDAKGFSWCNPDYNRRENEDVVIENFTEAWTWDAQLGSERNISQTLSLAPGYYRVEVDAIACRESQGDLKVNGVTFYVNNEKAYSVPLATAPGLPQHYALQFMVDGSVPTEIGIHVDASTEANWVACDNFILSYMGKVDFSEAYINLCNVVDGAMATFPDTELDEIVANTTLKEAYGEALAAAVIAVDDANSSDAVCNAAASNLSDALAALAASKANYDKLQNLYNRFESLSGALLEIDTDGSMETVAQTYSDEISELIQASSCEGTEEVAKYQALYDAYNALYNLFDYTSEKKLANEDKEELVNAINEKEAEMRAMWVECVNTLTTAQVAAKKNEIADMIGKYNRVDVEPGDITDLLVNPTFDENVDGWDNVNGMSHDPNGTVYTNEDCTIAGFCEKWTPGPNKLGKEYRIYQTLYLPNGLYRLEADAIASQQSDANMAVSGVKLYVKNGETYEVAVATRSEKPQHYVIDFFNNESTGTEIGFGCDANTTANWIAVDNFSLRYIGNSAEDFKEMIEVLEGELDEILAEGYPTAELLTKVQSVTKDADTALSSNNAEACYKAIVALSALQDETKSVLAQTSTLADIFNFTAEERVPLLSTSARNEFNNYLNDFSSKLVNGGIENVASVQKMIDEINSKFIECLQKDGLNATEANPFDMTAAIINPSYECWFEGKGAFDPEVEASQFNSFGWEGDTPSCNEYAAEYWRMDWTAGVEIHQTLKGLAPGWYKLYVQGYNRQGYGNDHLDAEVSSATLYAGNYQTKLCDVLDYKQEENLCDADESSVTIDDVEYYYPSNMPTSAVYFENGLYNNMLVFKVEQGQNSVTIGIRKDTYSYWDSLMFDNWSLDYVGTSQPTEQSTAIQSTSANNIVQGIYNLNGIQSTKLNKGINIIKTQKGVHKVLVK